MKRFGTVLSILMLSITPFLQSCLDDNESYLLAITTVHVIDENTFYFFSDAQQKMWPGDMSAMRNYKAVDGQRAYVYFNELEEKVSGYELNIQVAAIEDILTKGVIPLTEATADSIGDDRININYIGFGGGYLNIQYEMLATPNPSKLHMINLVRNETEGENENEESGYYSLEFRHNAYEDSEYERVVGVVSFKPPFTTHPDKGLKIRYNSIYDGEKYVKIDFINMLFKTGINLPISPSGSIVH